ARCTSTLRARSKHRSMGACMVVSSSSWTMCCQSVFAICQGVCNYGLCLVEFYSRQYKPRGTNALAAHTSFLLHQLDQLNEFRHSVHAQQGKEPTVEFECLCLLSSRSEIEQFHRLLWEGVRESGNPSDRTSIDGFHNYIVDAAQDLQPVTNQRSQGSHAANVGARFFDGMKIRQLVHEFLDVKREKVRVIGDGIVVQH